MPYIHSKIKVQNIVRDIIFSLLPLVIYGCYKNGYLVYQKNLIPFWLIFKPLILFGGSFIIYELYNLIRYHKLFLDYGLVPYLVLSMVVSPQISLKLYFLVITIFLLIDKLIFRKLTFNRSALLKLGLGIWAYLKHNYEYANLLEQKGNFLYNYFDLLMGHQIGGIASTSIIIAVIGYFILSYRQDIKDLIFKISYGTFFIGSLIMMLYEKNFNFTILFNANVIFALIFVAMDDISSPNTRGGLIIYSLLIGLLTLTFSYFTNYYAGVYLAILLTSFGGNIYDRLANLRIFPKKSKKNKGNGLG